MKNNALLLLLMLAVASCRDKQHRPDGVPDAALFVPTPKGGLWQVCTPPTQASRQVQCSIYSLNGKILVSEDFVAVDQQSLGPDLTIDPTAKLVGPPWINLKGGRI
jgi:hypothetical protein